MVSIITLVKRYLVMETVKAFFKTKKGKALVIGLVAGAAGIALPPEAIEALVAVWSALA